jgi:ribosomal protein S18 acetylase RimI-like enzyme
MSEFNFYNPQEVRELCDEIVPAYQVAFAGDPWYEETKCADEQLRCVGGFSALAVGSMCDVCGNCPIESAYEKDELIERFEAIAEAYPTAWYVEQGYSGLTMASIAWKALPSALVQKKYADNQDMSKWLIDTLGDDEVIWLDEVFANRQLKPTGNLQNFGRFVTGFGNILKNDVVAYRTIEPRMIAAAKRDFGQNTKVFERGRDVPDRRDFIVVNLDEPKKEQAGSIEISEFEDLADKTKQEVSEAVAAFTNGQLGEQPQMLPVSPEDIYKKYAGFVAFIQGVFAGYIGAAGPEEFKGKPMAEAGSLWVPKEYRGLGIAHKLVGTVSNHLISGGILPYAFCNPLSEKIFEDNNYVQSLSSEIPESALTDCADCPMKPSDGSCCDSILIYGGKEA